MTDTHAPNVGIFHVRKWYVQRDETLATEFGLPADGEPLVRVVVAAAIHNPCAGRHVEDLSEWAEAAHELGLECGRRLVAAMNGTPVRGYGKACLVGARGEYEHGNMLLTTHFADPVREAVGGAKAWIPSSGKRGGPGDTLDIPLAHKDALYVRAHYDTVTVSFPDAPAPDEIVIAFAGASRGRLHARLGGLQAADVRGEDGLR